MTEAEKICTELFLTFGRLTIFTMVIPIIAAWAYRKQLDKVLRIFLLYCVLTFLLNILELSYVAAANRYTEYLQKWIEFTGGYTHFLMILYQLKNFALLGWFYSVLVSTHNKNYGRRTMQLSILLCLAAIFSYLYGQGWKNYGVFRPTADAIFSFIVPLFYLWYLFRVSLAVPIAKNPYFWISFGLASANLIGLFLYLIGDSLLDVDYCLFVRFSLAKNIFEIISQILLAVGFGYARFSRYITSV